MHVVRLRPQSHRCPHDQHLRWIFAVFHLMVATSMVFALALDVIIVPCYTEQTYPVASNNTQFIIAGCDGRDQTDFFSTYVSLSVDDTPFGWSNLSVTVVNSISVSVLITPTATSMSLTDLSVVMNNITNPSSPDGNVDEEDCSMYRTVFAWCMPVLWIENVNLLVRPQISLTNIVVQRNVTNMIVLKYWTSAYFGRLYFENITFSGSESCFYFEGWSQSTSAVLSTDIAMRNITAIASGFFPLMNTVYPIVIDIKDATMYSSNFLINGLYATDNPQRGARASGLGTFNPIFVSATMSNCTVIIVNAIMDVVTQRSGVFVLLYRSSFFRDGSVLSFIHSSVVTANASVTNIYLVECQTSVQGSFLEFHNTYIHVLSSGNSTATMMFLFITSGSEVVKGSQLTLVDSHLHTLRGGRFVYSSASALSNASIVISDSSTSAFAGPGYIGALYFSTSLKSTILRFVNLTCHGGTTHIRFASSLDAVSLFIANSTFVYPSSNVIQIYGAKASRLLLTITNTLVSLLPSTSFIRLYGSTLSDSTLSINVGLYFQNQTLSANWEFLYMENSTIRDNSLLNASVAIVTTEPIAGRLLYMSSMTLSNDSSVVLNAFPSRNVTFAVAAPESPALVDVSLSLFNHSTLIIILPQWMHWKESAISQIAVISSTIVSNSGEIHVSGEGRGYRESMSIIRVNKITTAPLIGFYSCIVSNSSIVRISSIILDVSRVAGNATTTVIIAMLSNCTVSNGSRLAMGQLHFVVNTENSSRFIVAQLSASRIASSALILENMTSRQLSRSNQQASLLLNISSGTTFTSGSLSEATVMFRNIDLSDTLMLAADRTTSWWRSPTDNGGSIALTAHEIALTTRTTSLDVVFSLGGNVSAGTGIEFLISNSAFDGAGVVALDPLTTRNRYISSASQRHGGQHNFCGNHQ